MKALEKQPNSVGIITQQIVDFKLPAVPKDCVLIYNSNITQKKFSDYSTQEDLFKMNALITRWSVYIGIKKILPEELNLLANYIKDNYSELNEFDLDRAMNMLLKEELQVDAESYGTLSPLYISKVLNAYKVYKRESIYRVKDELEKIEKNTPKEIDKNERLESFKRLLRLAKEDSEKMAYVDFGNVLYNFVKKNKLIDNISEADIENAERYAENMVGKNLKSSAIQSVIHNKVFIKHDNKDKQLLINKRQYLINLWLKRTDIENIIENIKYDMLND